MQPLSIYVLCGVASGAPQFRLFLLYPAVSHLVRRRFQLALSVQHGIEHSLGNSSFTLAVVLFEHDCHYVITVRVRHTFFIWMMGPTRCCVGIDLKRCASFA